MHEDYLQQHSNMNNQIDAHLLVEKKKFIYQFTRFITSDADMNRVKPHIINADNTLVMFTEALDLAIDYLPEDMIDIMEGCTYFYICNQYYDSVKPRYMYGDHYACIGLFTATKSFRFSEASDFMEFEGDRNWLVAIYKESSREVLQQKMRELLAKGKEYKSLRAMDFAREYIRNH